jgi:hypothetical protein
MLSMAPLVVSAFADHSIRFVPFAGAPPDFIFDGTQAETTTHRYEVRTEHEEDEDGEESEASTLVAIDKGSGTQRVVFSPPANFELGVAVLDNKLVLKCGGLLFFIENENEKKQLKEIEKWCVDGDSEEPPEGCVPVDYSVYAHPRAPLLVVSTNSHHPVGDWLVVRRAGKNHLVGAVETINCGTIDRELVFGNAGSELLRIEDLDELVARAAGAPVIEHPWETLLAEFQARLVAASR